MKKLSERQRIHEVARIAAIPDDEIDTSDIPELTANQLRSGRRSELYRPIKKRVTMRLDADVIEWLKEQGPGYQAKANRMLRELMIRSRTEPGKRRTTQNSRAGGNRRR